MSKESASSGGIGFCGLLTIVLITLKLLGKFNHSWWLVFLPIWGLIALILGVVAIIFVVGVLWAVYKDWKADKARAARQKKA